MKYLINKYLLWIRRIRFFKRRNKLVNKDVTILCLNCLGGVIYNSLNLPFLSPTINLAISQKDFLYFVNHIKQYKNAELIEESSESYSYPLGVLKKEGLRDIHIRFRHYASFDEAKKKWFERFERINFKKIFVIGVIYKGEQDQDVLINEYNHLPYPTIILSYRQTDSNLNLRYVKFIDTYKDGWVGEFKGIFGKRAFDNEFNFVDEIFNRHY